MAWAATPIAFANSAQAQPPTTPAGTPDDECHGRGNGDGQVEPESVRDDRFPYLAPFYSARRATAGRTRAAVQPGQAAMRLAASSVTGTASRISVSGTSGLGATPAALVKRAHA